MFCGGGVASFGIDFSNRTSLEGSVSDNGVITLRWDVKNGQVVEVERIGGMDGIPSAIIYSGEDVATVITGLREGEYSYRIRELDSADWSEPVQVEVRYVSRSKLLWLMTLGGVVVVATIFTVVIGALRSRGKEGAS